MRRLPPGDVGARAGRMDSAWAAAWLWCEGGGGEVGERERGGGGGEGGGLTGRLTFEKMAY